jgi:hypothetical protein
VDADELELKLLIPEKQPVIAVVLSDTMMHEVNTATAVRIRFVFMVVYLISFLVSVFFGSTAGHRLSNMCNNRITHVEYQGLAANIF